MRAHSTPLHSLAIMGAFNNTYITSESSLLYMVQFPLYNIYSNYSTPPKSPVVSGSSWTAQESTDSCPRPPSPPPHTSPITVGGAKPAAGSYFSPSTTHHSSQPPREDSVKCETTFCMCVCMCMYCMCSV